MSRLLPDAEHVHLVLTANGENALRAVLAEAHRQCTRGINLRVRVAGPSLAEAIPVVSHERGASWRGGSLCRVEPCTRWTRFMGNGRKWSSARAHLTETYDALVRVELMLKWFPEGASYHAQPGQDGGQRTRIHTRIGCFLEDSTFIQAAELLSGRILAPRERGRILLCDTSSVDGK